MKVFDSFKSKNIEGLADWFDKYCMIDNAPWFDWFDINYCGNCDTVDENGREYAWCELNKKCKFFQEMHDTPSIKDIIKMWLNSEID